jgi:hypothetical protein
MTRFAGCATHTKPPRVYPSSSHSGTRHSPLTSIPFVLSFHALTNCSFSISFLLTFMHRMGGVGGAFLFSLPTSNLQTLISVFSYSSALFCSFLHSRKTQLVSFQAIPHSFAKTPGVGGYPIYRTLRVSRCGVTSLWSHQVAFL